MADHVVALALGTLRDLLIEKTKFLDGVSNEVRGLETQLKEMRCLLEDAGRRRHESSTVQNWIAEIRNLAYRAEDVVETYAVEISSRKRNRFGKFIKRYRIGSEILEIKSEVERVHKSMQAYGIREIIQGETSISSAANENQRWKWQTHPVEIEDCFVGKEDDLNRLVSLIVDDEKHRVIKIWGMGGIGKTTIARKIFNHSRTKHSFESLAWVCITQQCQIRSVLEEILKQLIPHQKTDIMNSSDPELVQLLCDVQKAKRCLIVLDDLWQFDHWDALKHAGLVAGLNNKILLTTRNRDVTADGFEYELELLKADDGWELLKKKAFCLDNIPAEFTAKENLFEKIGKEMVHKCGRLPLGICLLGGILCNKKSLKEWELVNNDINAYLYRSEGNKISAVMDLSYEDLPCYLKPCFLYMGFYGEDESVSSKTLCKLWIAEGLISRENYGSVESLIDIAEIYLRELVSRCMVQVEEVHGKLFGGRKLHDTVRVFCLSKGKDEDFGLKVMHYQDERFSIINKKFISNKTRHLVIRFLEDIKSKDVFTSFDDEIKDCNIRSLLFLGIDGKRIEFPLNAVDCGKFKLLRVLFFRNCAFEGGKLPTEIGNLICLRQLSFQDCELNELPDSIENLTRLYTLTLGMSDTKIPNVLNKMISLRNLYFPDYHIDKIENCRLKLEGLEKLETLHGFNSLVHDFKSISKMKNLCELTASVCDNKALCEIMDSVDTNWDKLHLFRLFIFEDCELTSADLGFEVLEKVFACSKLTILVIFVPIRKLQVCNVQSEIFPNLQILALSDTEIEDDPMEILEKLPLLDNLSLLRKSYVGNRMICHATGFPKLKNLALTGLPNLREWGIEEGAMPSLDTLKIGSCQNLTTIPDGLKFITTLRELKITGMPKLGSWLVMVVHNLDKIGHVPFISVD